MTGANSMAINVIRGAKSLENLRPPKQGRKEYRVDGTPGLFLRASPTKKVWYLRARVNGEKNPRWLKIGVYKPYEFADIASQGYTLKEATIEAEKLRDMIACGISPREQQQAAAINTFKSISTEFLKRGRRVNGDPWKPLTANAYRLTLEHDRFKRWHDVPITAITYNMVRDVIRELEREGKHTTAKRLLAYLRAFF